MRTTARRLTTAVLTGVTVLALAACGGHGDAAASATPTEEPSVQAQNDGGIPGAASQAAASPSATPTQSLEDWAAEAGASQYANSSGDAGEGATSAAIPDGVEDVIVKYATIEANQDSTSHKGVDDWIGEMKGVSTTDFSGASRDGQASGIAWGEAHASGASVAAKVTEDSCSRTPVPDEGDDSATIVCTLTTTLTDTDGNALQNAPSSWEVLAGSHTMQYTMTKKDGAWKVADESAPIGN